MSDPTLARRGGEHRVLEPVGAPPLLATRLDAFAELWDGEVRLELTEVVLTAAGHARRVERLGPEPQRLAGAFTETVAERGGLGPEAADATLVGTVRTVAPRHPRQLAPGTRVAVATPAGAVPLFAVPDERDTGSRVVRVRGHAILAPGTAVVHLADEPPELAALLARVADVPRSLGSGRTPVVLGADTGVGAVALAAAVAQGRHVTAVVRDLVGVRLARHLGAAVATVADLGDAVGTATLVTDQLRVRSDLVVLADPAASALAARLAPAVQVLTDPVAAPDVAAEVLRHAAATGRDVAIHAGRSVVDDGGAALRQLVGSDDALAALLRWRAGIAPAPVVPDPEPGAAPRDGDAGPDPEDP
ncbi:hypothetical protein FTX61_16045 [Nitriliruptoraceae bacterium ZYF776]|nr:hypothetical protein [Profundirhabdus halotolerans]